MFVPENSLRKEIPEKFRDNVLAGHPRVGRTRLDVCSLLWSPQWTKVPKIRQAVRPVREGGGVQLQRGPLLGPCPVPAYRREEVSLDLLFGITNKVRELRRRRRCLLPTNKDSPLPADPADGGDGGHEENYH